MTEITTVECTSFDNLLKGVDTYLDRKGRKKLKDEKNEESDVACDIFVAEEDQLTIIWPGVYGPELKGSIYPYKKYALSEELTWKKGIAKIKKFCKDNGILSVIELNTIETRRKFLIATFVEYLPFLNAFLRFYLRRKGIDEGFRCIIVVATEQKSIWFWPKVGTQNLVVIKFEPKDISRGDWEEIMKKVDLIESEYGVKKEVYANFYPK